MLLKLLITAMLVAATLGWWLRRSGLSDGSNPKAAESSLAQAYDVLGLTASCRRADIIRAHRRLMGAVHPDKGGSNYLAAQLNDAKQRLLEVHPD